MSAPSKPILGFIGLGEMGGPMAIHLAKAGYRVLGFDLNAERVQDAKAAGIEPMPDLVALVRDVHVIFTSLPCSESFVAVAERELLPLATAGQVFIDTGTAIPAETKRLAALFESKGAALLDVPVSGGGAGARRASLRMFAGGNRSAFERCRPLLEIIGGPHKLAYCGPSGSGQAVKGVNQLKSGLAQAARLEAVAMAVLSGVDPAVIHTAFKAGVNDDNELLRTIESFQAGLQAHKGVKFRELPYYLAQAKAVGFELPLTQALYAFLEKSERVVKDDHRDAPSFWNELCKRRCPKA